MKPFSIVVPAALALALSSCDPPPEEEESPAAEACEHAQEGPASTVDASETADLTAGDVSAAHTRHDVTLAAVDGTDSFGGFVRLDSVGGPTIVFVTVDVSLVATDAGGAAIALTATDESLCADVVKSFSGELPVGIVFLQLGPTDATTVSLVVEAENGPEEE